jgi:hypothetical protein
MMRLLSSRDPLKEAAALTRNGPWAPRRSCAALLALPCWSPGTPFGICYFRPTFCSFMPSRARRSVADHRGRVRQTDSSGHPNLLAS